MDVPCSIEWNRDDVVNRWMGLFWLPGDGVRDADLVEGVLKYSAEGIYLELDSERLHSELSLVPSTKDAWRRRVVGKLADGLFVSMEGCVHTGTTHYSMRRKTRSAFSVRGNVFLSNDEGLVSPDEIGAHEVHVEINGLPEWFASALSHPHPSLPYATGIPLTRSTRVEAECDDSNFEVDLDDHFKLRIGNTLYWGADGLFDLKVRQATVATIRTTDPVRADRMLEKVRPLVDLVRFLSGENCVVRSAYLMRTDRALPERYGGGPLGLRLLVGEQGHQFDGWGDMLFRWRDISGYEDTLLRKWYGLCAEHSYALRVLDSVVSQGESAEGGVVLMVGAMLGVKSSKSKKTKYEDFLRGLGLQSWGIDVATLGERISNLRGEPAHGRPLPAEENIACIYRFLVAAMRVYFLRKMGFSEEQVYRMARRHYGLRHGLGLREENLDGDAHNEMLRPGWIMEGTAR